VEDDGGVPSDVGHTSMARTATVSGTVVVEVVLRSYANADDANNAFETAEASLGAPVAVEGAGDAAAYAGGRAAVLKGAQVLDLRVDVGPEGQRIVEEAKAETGDGGPAYEELVGVAVDLAVPLAEAMTGEASVEPALALPAGAVDPCATVEELALVFPGVELITATYLLPEDPPALECLYELDGLQLYLSVATDTQLAGALEPSTAEASYAADRQAAIDQGGEVVDGSAPPAMIFFFEQAVIDIYMKLYLPPCAIRSGQRGSPKPGWPDLDPEHYKIDWDELDKMIERSAEKPCPLDMDALRAATDKVASADSKAALEPYLALAAAGVAG
jgi:hypothetical protein